MKAGCLPKFIDKWHNITKDKFVLDAIAGFKLPFIQIPIQTYEPTNPKFSENESLIIDDCIKKLLITGAVVKSDEESDQFISTIFTVPKPDGSRRPIINLRKLNEYLESYHFKMENIRIAGELVSKGSFMAVIDCQDAYHSISIEKSFQKYLKFRWRGTLYKYTVVPFGLSVAPRLYTKLNKPIVAYLRSNGVLVVSYLDDMLVLGRAYDECMSSLRKVMSLLETLGFKINVEKSQLIPSQVVRYLGFIINSSTMTLSLPEEKCNRVISKCDKTVNSSQITIRELAELIGTLIAAAPATKYGMLYTKQLEQEKTLALDECCNNWSGKVSLSVEAKSDLSWWILNAGKFYNNLHKPKPQCIITTDASPTGWGAWIEADGKEIHGHWSGEFLDYHINVLEIWAVFLGLRFLIKTRGIHTFGSHR